MQPLTMLLNTIVNKNLFIKKKYFSQITSICCYWCIYLSRSLNLYLQSGQTIIDTETISFVIITTELIEKYHKQCMMMTFTWTAVIRCV